MSEFDIYIVVSQFVFAAKLTCLYIHYIHILYAVMLPSVMWFIYVWQCAVVFLTCDVIVCVPVCLCAIIHLFLGQCCFLSSLCRYAYVVVWSCRLLTWQSCIRPNRDTCTFIFLFCKPMFNNSYLWKFNELVT